MSATNVVKCTDGTDHEFTDEVDDADDKGEVVGTTFICGKCGVRFDVYYEAVLAAKRDAEL